MIPTELLTGVVTGLDPISMFPLQFITGASRGIGLAIALRAARDGANVVIAAKTTDPQPNLEVCLRCVGFLRFWRHEEEFESNFKIIPLLQRPYDFSSVEVMRGDFHTFISCFLRYFW
jgi:hypothetical protein